MAYFIAIIIVMQGVTLTAKGNFPNIEACQKARSEFVSTLPVYGAKDAWVGECTKGDS